MEILKLASEGQAQDRKKLLEAIKVVSNSNLGPPQN